MFKKTKKIVVKFFHSSEGHSESSATFPINEGKLVEYLENKVDRFGRIIIERVDEEEIHLTTIQSLKHEKQEDRIEELNEVIRSYINNRAISSSGFAIFAKGTLKGVFGNRSHADLKRQSLLRKYTEEDIEIKPIQVGSFEDFE